MRTSSILAGALLLVAAASASTAGTIYVDSAATGAGTGQSWADAYTTLAAALAAAVPGDAVWIAQGTYPSPSSSGFALPSGVGVYGGFAGVETSLLQRDPALHETVLLGASGRCVATVAGAAAGTVLDGVTIRAGQSVQAPGAGVRIVGGAPTLRACRVAANTTSFSHGGGVYIQDAAASLEGCSFEDNYVHLGSGGGLYIGGDSAVTVTACVFLRNTAVTGSGGAEGQGAGIENHSGMPVTVTGCTFDSNLARQFGSCCPIEQSRGGGISSFADGLTVRDCVFVHNRAHYGGGLFAWGNTLVVNSVFHDNTAFTVPLSGGASGGGYGGAIACLAFTPDLVQIVNCTVSRNLGTEAAGIATFYSIGIDLRNSIVWGNIASGEDVSPIDAQVRGTYEATYSCIEDLLTPIPGEDPPNPAHYPGCIVADPQFVAPLAGDVRLAASSPAIDAGGDALVPPGVVEDAAGNLRSVRGLPGPGPAVVDMGALEFGADPCAPVFTLTPTDAAAPAGSSATFTAAAAGAGDLAYRWRLDGVPLADGPSAVGTVSGSGTPVLHLTSLVAADALLDCTVSSACGSAVTPPAHLLVGTACPADWNGDGQVNSTDISAYLTAWLTSIQAGSLVADVNGDGAVNSSDISAFLTAWLQAVQSGC